MKNRHYTAKEAADANPYKSRPYTEAMASEYEPTAIVPVDPFIENASSKAHRLRALAALVTIPGQLRVIARTLYSAGAAEDAQMLSGLATRITKAVEDIEVPMLDLSDVL